GVDADLGGGQQLLRRAAERQPHRGPELAVEVVDGAEEARGPQASRDALRRGRSAAAQRGHARHARQVEERQRGVVVLAAQGERLLEEPLGALVVLQAQEREAQAGDGPRQRVAVPDLAEEAGRLLVEGYGGLGLPL